MVVLQTLGLIPTAATARPPIVQQSGDALPAGAAAALASGGAAHRPVAPPNLAPPPPIRPPMTSNPGLRDRQRVAGRLPVQNTPALAPGGPPASPDGSPQGSPPPAPAAPPVSQASSGGDTSPGHPALTAVVEGETSKQ